MKLISCICSGQKCLISLSSDIKPYTKPITEYVINDMFKVRDGYCQTLSYKDVKDKFVEDMFFFSSGYFRMKALECIGLINKIENVKKQNYLL